MGIGIGLPSALPDLDGPAVTDWAVSAERAGFDSLGALDRIVYDSFEPLLALTAAAAVTEQIKLVTSAVIGPARNTAMLAKQAATLDRLSRGRLTLGIGIGGRDDDYAAAEIPANGRGRRLEGQLDRLRRIWAGERAGEAGGIGPAPWNVAGPDILVGGSRRYAMDRAVRYGDGWIVTGRSANPQELAAGKAELERAWQRHGRHGHPRITALFYFSLGGQAVENAERYLRHYYRWLGAQAASAIAAATATSGPAVRDTTEALIGAGADEVIAFPCSASAEQVELLAAALERSAIHRAGHAPARS